MPNMPRPRNARLRLLLTEADWTHESLARAVNTLAGRTGLRTQYDRTSIAHWLGGVRPRPPAADLVCQALSQRLGRLVTPFEAGFEHGTDLVDAVTGPSAPIQRLVALAGAEADPAQRVAIRALAFRPLADLPAPLGVRTASPQGGVTSLTAARAAAMQEMARLSAHHLDSFGGGSVRPALAAYVCDVVGDWLGRPEGAHHVPSLSGAAQLTHLMALAAADMGDEGQAQHCHLLSLSLAVEAGDRSTYVMALRAMSVQAARLGHSASALRWAETALDVLPGRTQAATRAYVLAQSALTQAMTCMPRTALRSLLQAERQMERAHGAGSGSFDYFSQYALADFAYQQAQTLALLKEDEPARDAYGRALSLRAPHRTRSRALTRAALAEHLLAHGCLDEACGQWGVFLDEVPSLRSRQAVRRITHMRQELTPYRRHGAAGELLNRAVRPSRTATESHCQ